MRNPNDGTARDPRGERRSGQKFPSTHWSIIQRLQGNDEERETALNTLCATYWMPVYSFVRRCGRSPEVAEDITQAFFARLITKRMFDMADPTRGRLRSFILRDLRFFMRDEWAKDTAERRGGGQTPVSIDVDSAEILLAKQLATEPDADKVFDREWGRAMMTAARTELEAEYRKRGRHEDFTDLGQFLLPDAESEVSQEELAQRTGRPLPTLRTALFRLRRRFRHHLVTQVELTVTSHEDVDEELRYLRELFRG